MQNAGRLSGDGKWQWDGTKWVPTDHQAPAPPAMFPSSLAVPGATTNNMARVSFWSGIASWTLCPLLGAVVAVVTGHIALRQLPNSGQAGGDLAIYGLVMGYLHLAVWVIGLFMWLVFLGGIAFLFTSAGH